MSFFKKLFGGNKEEVAAPEPVKSAPAGAGDAVPENWQMPVAGKVIELAEVPDPAFSSGAMGIGFAIEPSGGAVVSPVAGTVVTVFPTRHAVGIEADNGLEILIHIGVDTVNLQGKGFTSKVKEGDKVVPGQTLVEVDWNSVKANAPSIVTPVLFTALDESEASVTIEGDKPKIVKS